MRLLLLGLAALLLAGCNMVMARTPLFGPADSAGAPRLRSGLWVAADPACRFDPKAPISAWPDCAEPTRIQEGRGQLLFGDKDEGPVLLAKGDPAILQFQTGDPGEDRIYVFAGLRPTRTDWFGLVVEFDMWGVACGPPPPPDARNPDGTRRWVTLEPGPGLTLEEGGCVAHSADAVRAAATASEGRASPERFRWLRRRP